MLICSGTIIQKTDLTNYLNKKTYRNKVVGKMSYDTIENNNKNK